MCEHDGSIYQQGQSSKPNGQAMEVQAQMIKKRMDIESMGARNLLFINGMHPLVNRKSVISGRLGDLSIRDGQSCAQRAIHLSPNLIQT